MEVTAMPFSKEYRAKHFKAEIMVVKQPTKYRRNIILYLVGDYGLETVISQDLSKKDVKQLIKLLQWALKQ